MTVRILVAPAGAGKTEYALTLARQAAAGLAAPPHMVVASSLQVRACRRRLALGGGAMGVRLETFDRLHDTILNLGGEVYTALSEPVRHRLIRAVVDSLPLQHFGSLAERPGFIQVLQDLIAELKADLIEPPALQQAVAGLGAPPRLAELAELYSAYQRRLQANGWADAAGLGWLAIQSLQRHPDLARDWPLLLVDGFAAFTPAQQALLKILAGRVGSLVVTITDDLNDPAPRLVHRQFHDTLTSLTRQLDAVPTPLPASAGGRAPALAHLEASLFRGAAIQPLRLPAAGALDLLEAADRAAEVRAALRWLKERVVLDGIPPTDVALLAPSITPYRDFIQQTAEEFGLPVRFGSGAPLRGNPAVAALLDLLRLSLPLAPDRQEPSLPRRLLVETWRSPYFDWSLLGVGQPGESGILTGGADALDAVAHWGRITGGQSQWEQELAALAGRVATEPTDEDNPPPSGVPLGDGARALLDQLHAFLGAVSPPAGQHTAVEFVGWLERLIGPDLAGDGGRPGWSAENEGEASLRLVERARQAAAAVVDRDVAALRAFKDVLGGLVWAEQALGPTSMDFPHFFADLVGAVDAHSYQAPAASRHQDILAADFGQARGLPFRAAAVLGLAEGEFPAALMEDPFLRDSDRRSLRDNFGLPLEPSLGGAQLELFYETVTRATQRLLLSRPRLADNGSAWQPSPYWEEVLRLVDARPRVLTSQSVAAPGEAASWPELLEGLAARDPDGLARAWAATVQPAQVAALDLAASVLRRRRSGEHHPDGSAGPAFHGGLAGELSGELTRRFGPGHGWSASRLETYRTCPFYFFAGTVLGLQPREEPEEGMDVRQLGTIYHLILEAAYQGAADSTDLAALQAALEATAPGILDDAPRRQGFRVTAWWAQSRQEILKTARRTVTGLAAIQGEFRPLLFEAAFGMRGRPPLVLHDGEDSFMLRGIIDRVDRAPDGGLRIVDYKTSGPGKFTLAAGREGKKLQLALYALAARDALDLGRPVDGFYWHVGQAEASALRLEGRIDGPDSLLDAAVLKSWEAVRGARAGEFAPHTPDDGCPSYCPAASFCWQFEPGYQPRTGG